MALGPISDVNHTANAVAVGFPLAAWLGSWIGIVQPLAALVLTLCGITYYFRMFYKDWKAGRGKP